MDDLHHLVLAVLRLNPSAEAEDIAQWMNVSLEEVQAMLEALGAAGLVPRLKR
jgi:Mn-dependent DtxR family transcriptional regulator